MGELKTMEEIVDLQTKFFKIILPSIDSQRKLRIPDKFVGKYGHELSDVVRLTDPMGGVWCVELEKMEKTLWFHDGWEKFVEDHFIGYGYLLVFTYGGNSNFNVLIFDLTTTEAEYPLNNSRNFERTKYSTQNSISEKEEISDDDSVKVLASFPGKPAIVISSSKSGTPSACGDQSTNIRRHDPQTMHDLSFSSAEFIREVKRGKNDAAERSKSQRCYLTRSKCKIEDEGIKTGSKKVSPSACGDWVTNGRRHDQQTIHDLSFPSAEFTGGVKRGKSDAAETSKSQRCYLTRSKCKIENEGNYNWEQKTFTKCMWGSDNK
ncbi:Uncharacterized protein Adt_26348 [Abeliophyllum distichum]|uniref:TF-B3 domain-containing protein n=1 Tax=Abeliophyllum distichum TaxID=126358 RepID=A0ABD1RQM0_9LAMI